jgi:hypothetical protein
MAAETNPVQIQIQSTQVFDEEKYCCNCRRDPRICGLFICLVVWGLLIPNVCLYAIYSELTSFGYWSLFFLIFAYLVYLYEAFMSKTSRYLWNMKVAGEEEDIGMYVERLKRAPPLISMTCECYHYETRTRYVTEYINGQNGTSTRTRVETYQERVVTHSGQESFIYREWSDDSGSLSEEIFKYKVVKFDLFKSWTAANTETQAALNRQYDEFQRKYRGRDIHFDSSYDADINEYKPHILWVVGSKWFLSWKLYAVITIFFFSSVFYRYWFDRYSVKANFEFKKIVKL